MNEPTKRVSVQILDKEFQVACKPTEKDALLLAAKELDARMRKVRSTGAIIGIDRIAVMVALNLCHELQQHREEQAQAVETNEQLSRLADKLERALTSET
jgi:cell division protein ZapA